MENSGGLPGKSTGNTQIFAVTDFPQKPNAKNCASLSGDALQVPFIWQKN